MRRLVALTCTVAVLVPATVAPAALAAPADAPSLSNLLDARVGAFEGSAGIVVQDGTSGKTVYEHDADASVITASLYKLGVLVEVERRVDAGTMRYSNSITIEPEDVTEDGSYELVGTALSLDDALEQMITISDNGAAHALERIVGARQINDTLAALHIQPFRLAEDADEDNVASPRAIATLFTLLAQRRLISQAASDRMLKRLERQKINDRLPAALPAGTVVAHKTGNIGLAAPAPVAMSWRLVDRSNNPVADGVVPLGVITPEGPGSYLVPFLAPPIRGPFTLELFAVTDGRVASAVVRKSIEIDAARTYPGDPAAGLSPRLVFPTLP